LNWFIRGGIEHVIGKALRLSAGIMYQHMSNGGQTKPNPGIDALGFTLGYSWAY
jgi:long-subunit fatty acid transport protein